MSSLDLAAKAFAVVGEIIKGFLSASQIERFRRCERSWGWRYIARIPDPSGPAAALGTECDDTQLQPYLRDDRPIDYSRRSGYIVQPGLAFLPKPKAPGLEVQRWIVLPSSVSGVSYQGYIDLWMPDAGHMPYAAYDPSQGPRKTLATFMPPVVADFKTTGNWKYQKHAKDLETDVQAQLYAHWALLFTGESSVDLIWIYFGTKGAYKAKRSHLRVTREHAAEQFQAIEKTAAEIHAHRVAKTSPLDLEPSPDACEMFGGCPYRANCNLSPGQIVDAKAAQHARQQEKTKMSTNQAPMSTGDLLAKLRGQQSGGAPPSAPPAAPPPSPAPAAPVVEPLPAWATAPVDPIRQAATHAAREAAKPLGINPPEKALAPAPPVGSVQVAPVSVSNGQAPNLDKPAADEPVKRRGPGRPKKDLTGADALAHTAPPAEPGAPVLPACVTNNISVSPETIDAQVKVTWGREKFSPIAYNDFDVGPFEAIAYAAPGETIGKATERVYAELCAFAETVRAEKAISYQKTLATFGSSR